MQTSPRLFTRRRFVTGLITVPAIVPVLAACSPGPGSPPPTATAAASSGAMAPATTPPVVAGATSTAQVVQIVTPSSASSASREGEVVLVVYGADRMSHQALANAYMKANPGVKVSIEMKAGTIDEWLQWLKAQFAAGVPRFSIVNEPQIKDFILAGKILNQAPYLGHTSPYTKQPWQSGFVDWALDLVRDSSTGEMYTTPYDSVKTFWVYNKRMFDEAGIGSIPDQPTWSDMLNWCKKLKAKGYIPIAMAGTADRLWTGGQFPWLVRSAADQYCRAQEKIIHAQKGDWDYREGIDDKWVYDPSDPHNDDPSKVSLNVARHVRALRDKEIRFNGDWWAEYAANLNLLFGPQGFTEPGWMGTQDAYPLFLSQKAAMYMVSGSFLTQFEKDIRSLAEGKYRYQTATKGAATPTPSAEERSARVFEYGTFNFPSMEGNFVAAKARCNELTSGYLSVPKKDRKQNDLEMDFIMFWTSPQGMGVFTKARLDPNNLNGGVGGPPVIKDVQLPADIAAKFAKLTFIGNYEKPGSPGDAVARGFFKYEPSIRDWEALLQSLFRGEISPKEYAAHYQGLLETHWVGLLKYLKVTNDDLDHPEKRPPAWTATGPY